MSVRGAVLGAAACLLSCLVLSGCGDDDDGADSAGTGGAAQQDAELQNKTLGILSLGEALEGVHRLTSATREAAESVGWDVQLADAQGDPEKAAAAMRSLVQQDVDAIVDAAVEPSIIKQGLTAAAEAEIPVVGLNLGMAPEGIIADFVSNERENTALIDGELAERVPEGGKIAATRFLGTSATKARYEQFERDVEKYGWDVVAVHDLVPPNFGPNAENFAKAILTANPDLQGFWTGSDPAAAGVARGISAVKSDAIVVGYNGDGDALAAIRAGGPFKSTVAFALERGAWMAVDTLIRVLAGETVETGTTVSLPGEVVTESNVPAEGEGYFNAWGDHVAEFGEKWKRDYDLGG